MKPEYHLFISLLLGSAFFIYTGSIAAGLACFLAGFFIDLDHFIDFWIYKKRITYTKEFFQHYHRRLGKLYVVLHSYELVIGLLVIVLVFNLGVVGVGVVLGMGFHLVLDFLTNDVHPLAYFLSYRMAKGFDVRQLYLETHK